MSYPPPPEPFPEPQPYPPPDPAFQPPGSPVTPPPGSPVGPPPGPPPGAPAGPTFQPGVATPNYQQQPSHQETGYHQPAYPPTAPFPGAYGPPPGPPPGPVPMPPPRKPKGTSAGVLWSLIAVFALLLCAGAATAGLIAYRNSDTGTTASQNPPPPPGPARPDPTAPPSDEPSTDPSTDPDEPTRAPADGAVVRYEVTGDGRATIQYLRADSQIESLSRQKLPWRTEVTMPKTGFLVSLTASREGGGSGTITCRVTVDGKTVSEQTSRGTLAIVACLDFDLDFD